MVLQQLSNTSKVMQEKYTQAPFTYNIVFLNPIQKIPISPYIKPSTKTTQLLQMKKLILTLLAIPLFMNGFSQFPDGVKTIDATPNQTTEYRGDLSDGAPIEDLSWASTSSNACFPGTQNSKFRGNHVLHGFQIRPYSEVTITVIPNNKNANFSLYGYQLGSTNFSMVPNLSSCVSCEADHKWEYPKRGKTQDHTRSIFFNSTNHPYNIFVGVVGADAGTNKGAYTLKIEYKSRVENTAEQQPLKVYRAKSEKGKTLAYSGNLNEGVKIQDLSWAANSSVACFPATQNHKFTGNHVFYITEIPTRSKMYITVIPDNPKDNFSIYSYMTGVNSEVLPPNISSCLSCEAEHKWDRPKRGKTQDHTRTVYQNAINNPYRVVIGVAGAEDLTEGGFTLQIKTE